MSTFYIFFNKKQDLFAPINDLQNIMKVMNRMKSVNDKKYTKNTSSL